MICMIGGCGRGHKARGLCKTHYDGAREIIAAGKTTWKKLEDLGRVGRRRNTDHCAMYGVPDGRKKKQAKYVFKVQSPPPVPPGTP